MDLPFSVRETWTVEVARAYQALCAFSAWSLYVDPNVEALERLSCERSMFLEAPFSDVASDAAAALEHLLSGVENEAALQALASEVHQDRTYLFYMVGSSHTSPYESVYRTDDATMFGPTTLEVREAYRLHGLAFDREGNEPDDHLGIEFSFAAHMLGKVAEALEKEDSNEAASLLDDLAAFVSNHMLVFAPTYLTNLQARARSGYYAAIAEIAQAVLKTLACALKVEASQEVSIRGTACKA